MLRSTLAILVALSVSLPTFADAKQHDIVDTAAKAGSFNTLLMAAKAAGLVDALKGDGPLTVFAPTDDAFAKLPKGTVEGLLKDTAKLKAILLYHVVSGKVTADKVTGLTHADTLSGAAARIKVKDGKVHVGGATVVKADIHCTNGVIHVIDSVILPPADIVDTAAKAGTFKTLLAAAKAAGLVDALKGKGPLTVFAPSDAAFAKLPEGTVEALLKDPAKLKSILLYHVVPARAYAKTVLGAASHKTLNGQSIAVDAEAGTVDGAKIVKTDIHCSNGVIHVIDAVILPKP